MRLAPKISAAIVTAQTSTPLEAVKSTPPIYLPLYIPFVLWCPGRGAQLYCLLPSPFSVGDCGKFQCRIIGGVTSRKH